MFLTRYDVFAAWQMAQQLVIVTDVAKGGKAMAKANAARLERERAQRLAEEHVESEHQVAQRLADAEAEAEAQEMSLGLAMHARGAARKPKSTAVSRADASLSRSGGMGRGIGGGSVGGAGAGSNARRRSSFHAFGVLETAPHDDDIGDDLLAALGRTRGTSRSGGSRHARTTSTSRTTTTTTSTSTKTTSKMTSKTTASKTMMGGSKHRRRSSLNPKSLRGF